MPTLRCLESYAEGPESYSVGQLHTLDEERAARLMRGSPGSWEVAEGEVAIGGPDEPVNYDERRREQAVVEVAAAKVERERSTAAHEEAERVAAEARATRRDQAAERREETMAAGRRRRGEA